MARQATGKWAAVGIALMAAAAAPPAAAEERVALLMTPPPDQAPVSLSAVADGLSALGFEVTTDTIDRTGAFFGALARFERDASDADIALVIYAGDVAVWDGRIYLAPPDAPITRGADLARSAAAFELFVATAGQARAGAALALAAPAASDAPEGVVFGGCAGATPPPGALAVVSSTRAAPALAAALTAETVTFSGLAAALMAGDDTCLDGLGAPVFLRTSAAADAGTAPVSETSSEPALPPAADAAEAAMERPAQVGDATEPLIALDPPETTADSTYPPPSPPVVREPASNEMPAYPWPPEAPSSIARLDRFFEDLRGATVGDVSDRLTAALEAVGYEEYRLYGAPGGFVLATRVEAIDDSGATLPGGDRYLLPEDPRTASFAAYLRSLFLRAPPGFWRYVAVVVTDQPYRPDGSAALESDAAVERLGDGALRLTEAVAAAPFGQRHGVDALIYEYRKTDEDATAQLLAPGRIPPSTHLDKIGLAAALGGTASRPAPTSAATPTPAPTPAPETAPLSRRDRLAAVENSLSLAQKIVVEEKLIALGLMRGEADGRFDALTRSAIRQLQVDRGLEVTGYLDLNLSEELARP